VQHRWTHLRVFSTTPIQRLSPKLSEMSRSPPIRLNRADSIRDSAWWFSVRVVASPVAVLQRIARVSLLMSPACLPHFRGDLPAMRYRQTQLGSGPIWLRGRIQRMQESDRRSRPAPPRPVDRLEYSLVRLIRQLRPHSNLPQISTLDAPVEKPTSTSPPATIRSCPSPAQTTSSWSTAVTPRLAIA
jgi:hypothetical protein